MAAPKSPVIVFVACAYGLSTYATLLHQIIRFMSVATCPLAFVATVFMRLWHLYASVISRNTCLRSASSPPLRRRVQSVCIDYDFIKRALENTRPPSKVIITRRSCTTHTTFFVCHELTHQVTTCAMRTNTTRDAACLNDAVLRCEPSR